LAGLLTIVFTADERWTIKAFQEAALRWDAPDT